MAKALIAKQRQRGRQTMTLIAILLLFNKAKDNINDYEGMNF